MSDANQDNYSEVELDIKLYSAHGDTNEFPNVECTHTGSHDSESLISTFRECLKDITGLNYEVKFYNGDPNDECPELNKQFEYDESMAIYYKCTMLVVGDDQDTCGEESETYTLTDNEGEYS
ncbi:hypothetical protein IWW39_000039 [Coemansia spiralis]|uniref:Uncharacterized protein n=1 Tax=Coemansia spiralis TaxID=417178 RepID=A0A9W8GQK4_9FUNG|nr:hypothetical protein IWW39_000039 [Coemansia spiralis]